jgi:hypothetical protein
MLMIRSGGITIPAVKQRVAQIKMQVELVHRCRILTDDSTAMLFRLQRALESSDIWPGASCGSGGVGSRTLGGKMCPKNPDTGSEVTCSISNHHVFRHQLVGEGPFTTFDNTILVDSPSTADRERYISSLERESTAKRRRKGRGESTGKKGVISICTRTPRARQGTKK